MSSETGHTKNVSNLETMISHCTGYGPTYNPSNSEIKLSELTTFHDECKATLKDVKITETPFNEAEGIRNLLFKSLKPTGTKMLNALKAANAPSTVIADAITIHRKLQGKRVDNTTIEIIEGQKTKNRVSVSQQSYDMQIDHFEKFIELASIESKYNPNEIPLQVKTLTDYKNQLQSVNTELKTLYVPYSNALIARNKKLYDPETGIVARARMVKSYVKSVFGASSPEYKQISKLIFKQIK